MPEEPIEWRVQMGAHRPGGRLVAGLAITLAAFAGFALLHSFWVGLVSGLVIFGSTAELWFGIKYKLDKTGATSKTGISVTAIPWSDVKRMMVTDAGVTLSPLPHSSRLDNFRGVFLRPGDMGKEKLLEAIFEYGGDHVREMG